VENNRTAGVYNFLGATGGTGTGASFNVVVANDKTITIDIVSPGVGYTDNDLLTITNAQFGWRNWGRNSNIPS